HDAQGMIGGIVPLLHPGIDVVAALDLPFVDVRRVAESAGFVRDPERPVAIASRVTDEDVGHGLPLNWLWTDDGGAMDASARSASSAQRPTAAGIPVSPHDRSFGEPRRGPSVSAGQFIADPPVSTTSPLLPSLPT